MSEFERQQPSYRLVETLYGDTLQDVAARELGNSNLWPELIWLNRLTPPYLTNDPAEVSSTVLLNGSLIKVPAPKGVATDDAKTGQVFERDCQLLNKQLADDGMGDFAILAGVPNLKQQLTHRLNTPKGQARRHADYGCLVWGLKGKVTGGLAAMLGAQYVKATLEADYRISAVLRSEANILGDTTRVIASAQTIAGSSVDLLT